MSKWFMARDRHSTALFGTESRAVLEVYEGADPHETAQDMHVDLMKEYPTEAEAEAAVKAWAKAN